MSKLLDVFFQEHLVGQLQQDKHGRISYSYETNWLTSEEATPLSQSLPLRERPFESRECQGFFAGVLPEEENRKLIAAILGVSANNDFSLLEQIGGECAGAVSFLPTGQRPPQSQKDYQRVDEKELIQILEELPHRPLMAGKKDVRLSLAGAQNKLAVHLNDEGISLPLNDSPSTHILKPGPKRFPDLVANEAFCMDLAKQSGLPTAEVSVGKVGNFDYLLMERYDREWDDHGNIHRLHQEDFCQAMGRSPLTKYQHEGGPSAAESFNLLREVSSAPALDLITLLEAFLFNYLIGNNDAHGKNFSLLYRGKSQTRLTPLYDLVSTTAYPDLSPKMAMKIGSKYHPDDIRKRHWQTLWQEAGLSETAAKKRALQFAEKVNQLAQNSHSDIEIIETIKAQISYRTTRFKKQILD